MLWYCVPSITFYFFPREMNKANVSHMPNVYRLTYSPVCMTAGQELQLNLNICICSRNHLQP